MAYIKIRFGKNLGEMHSRLQRTIDDMFRGVNPLLVLPEHAWCPQIDMYETPREIIIMGEIPGVRKEDLRIELDHNAVRISGIRRDVPRVSGMRYHLAEISYGPFERILRLPLPISPDKVKASYTDGLLKITMAKKPRDPVQRIPIGTR